MSPDVVALIDRSTEEAARARADRIRQGLRDYLETVAEFALAFERGDWQVLGYPSWQAYLDGEYGADRLRVPEVHRTQAVATLRHVGMSTRAIGAALNISKATAAREVASVSTEADDLPSTVRSLDGRQRPATRPTPPPPPAPAPVVIEERGPAPAERVWIATARKGIAAHAIKSTLFTRCSRATRTGLTLTAQQAADRWQTTWCRTCWPEQETTRVAAGASETHDPRASDTAGAEFRGSAPATDTDPLAGVGQDYETDPARRIAAVAAVAPEFVQPVAAGTHTAAGADTGPADGAAGGPDAVDAGSPVARDADHAAPALVPPSTTSPVDGGTGVTPGLGLVTIARVRAALHHLRAVGGRRTAPHRYELPFASTAPPLHRGDALPVDVVDVEWFRPTDVGIRWLAGGGRYEPVGGTDFYPASVDQALDVLCAFGILPARISSQFAAGVQVGLRGGDAIDGEIVEVVSRG
ncbi:hypothetical protein [Micromonospora humidisoli]|uniref:Uncharacterized protein n=1 Tax=Micromonospora humidisoli TaxID=2807622 RepID=A0ABS2JDU7_9ACTN|nr:hypothetical protein [Micromonospora humidisoli]MBM7083624.1 hypothetical protein [Micromonospora humidisoli]